MASTRKWFKQKSTSGLALILSLLVTVSCAPLPGRQVAEQVEPITPGHELTDSDLLNVSIKVFDPGELPVDPDKRRGLAPEIREAEARFAPIHLKHTLQRTGYWGVVRVVPDDDINAEVLVRGKILFSDGESLALAIEAVDSRNVVWFSKTYNETARTEEYEGIAPEKKDTFQDLFNSIANDLAIARNGLQPSEIGEIRQVAQLKYADSMAPDYFNGYLTQTPDGRTVIQRLPAEQDPMVRRVEAVRARDDMLVDTINDYYDIYYHDLWEPYANWRKFRQQEVVALRQLEREALGKQLLGITAIVGAIALGVATDKDTSIRTQPIQQLLIAGGAYSMYSGFQTHQEGAMNQAAIEELGHSFSAEAEPLVIDIEGTTVRLTGSAEQQYARWRAMLRRIYAEETGLIPRESQVSAPIPSPDTPGSGLDQSQGH